MILKRSTLLLNLFLNKPKLVQVFCAEWKVDKVGDRDHFLFHKVTWDLRIKEIIHFKLNISF